MLELDDKQPPPAITKERTKRLKEIYFFIDFIFKNLMRILEGLVRVQRYELTLIRTFAKLAMHFLFALVNVF